MSSVLQIEAAAIVAMTWYKWLDISFTPNDVYNKDGSTEVLICFDSFDMHAHA